MFSLVLLIDIITIYWKQTKTLEIVNNQLVLDKINIPVSDVLSIQFVKAGEKSCPGMVTKSRNLNVLAEARDWVCDFDLPDLRGDGPPYAFPVDIDANDLRCDGYIVSRSRKICIPIRLTVPFEDIIERWHLEKMERYSKA